MKILNILSIKYFNTPIIPILKFYSFWLNVVHTIPYFKGSSLKIILPSWNHSSVEKLPLSNLHFIKSSILQILPTPNTLSQTKKISHDPIHISLPPLLSLHSPPYTLPTLDHQTRTLARIFYIRVLAKPVEEHHETKQRSHDPLRALQPTNDRKIRLAQRRHAQNIL